MDTFHPFLTAVQKQFVLRAEMGLKEYLRPVFTCSVHPKATETATKRCRVCGDGDAKLPLTSGH